MEKEIIIDAQAPCSPFPHFWEHMFGSCHAPVTLCEDWRNDLRTLKEIVDVRFIRFHGIFDREVGIYRGLDGQGNLILNFTRVDLIYDGLLKLDVRPFVELGFMPPEMSSKPVPHSFWYHSNVAPPRDPRQWYQLISGFTRHLVERYGLEEVAQWYFEVWNEPNIDFWVGDPQEETYYALYDLAAAAIKDVSPLLRVGGPSTAMAAWIDRFIAHCVAKSVPLDFVSTHVYPNDTAKNVLGIDEEIPRSDMVGRAVRKVYGQVEASARPELPIIWSEYNAGFDGFLDAPFVGPWLANNIRLSAGLQTEMSYWTFTDAFFEEAGVSPRVFNSDFGLIATGGIPKASFNAFKILHYLGDQQLAINSDSALLTRRSSDGNLVLAVWNYNAPGQKNGRPKDVNIQLPASERSFERAKIFLVDDDHGSPLKLWKSMGSPACPSMQQQDILRREAELPPPLIARIRDRYLAVSLKPDALAVIEFSSNASRPP